MIKKPLLLLLAYLFTTILFGQSIAPAELERKSSYESIDNYIIDAIDSGIIPGGVFLIAKNGEINYFKSFGFENKEINKLYKNDDIFRIASMTKNVTVVGILQLMEQKKIDLDDAVSKYIPSFKSVKVLDKFNEIDSSYTLSEAKKEITIRNLLTHTSGIYYGFFESDPLKAIHAKNDLLNFGLANKDWNTEEMVDKIARTPLAFQPGTEWKYGLNMEVLGRIIEIVSKLPLDKYFSKNIFEPLHMKDTYFYLPKNKQERLVSIHPSDTVQNVINNPSYNYPFMVGNNHFAGGGGLSSTAHDYASLCMALANNGSLNGVRILKKVTVEMINDIQFSELDEINKGFYSKVNEIGFGLGYTVIKNENLEFSPQSEGTYSWSGIFNTKFFIDPEKEVIFVGLTQMISFENQEFWNLLTKEIYKSLNDN